jgi:hypothetical protein
MAARRAHGRLDGPDLRRHIRIPSIIPVDYQVLGAAGEKLDPEIRTAFTKDLSEGGLRLELTTVPEWLARRLKDNEVVGLEVDIKLPGRRLRLPGKVMWRAPGTDGTLVWLVGVQFTSISAEDSAAIVAYARRAARRPLVIRSVVAGLVAALIVGGIVYSWQTGILRTRVETTTQALVQSERKVAKVSDRLGDSQVDLGWLAVEVREIADALDERAGRVPPRPQSGVPAMEELRRGVERLRTAVQQPAPTKGSP